MNGQHPIRYFAVTIFLLLGMPAAGQQTPESPRPDTGTTADPPQSRLVTPSQFASPKATMFTFLDAINRASQGQPSAWADVFECLDLSASNPQRARDTALELWGVLNRLERIDESTPLPNAPEVAAQRLTGFTYFPDGRFDRSLLQRAKGTGSIAFKLSDSGTWKFSAQTIASIHDLYTRLADVEVLEHLVDERYASPALWLRSKVPSSLKRNRLLTLEYWQWLGVAVLILLGVTLDQTVRFMLRLMTNRALAQQRAIARKETVAAAVRPLGLLAAGLLWLVMMHLLNLPDQALLVLSAAVRLFTVLASTWAAWCVTDLICEILIAKAAKTATKFDDVLVPLFRKTLKVLIIAAGLIWSAYALNIEVLPLLTGLGIGGLAFAFAAKDTIENFFGSVAVVLDRPFEVGDWVVIGDVEGTVEEVGFRSTRVRTFYNSQVTVPNATLVRATVDNYGRRRYRRLRTHIGIQYDTPPDKIIAFTEGIRELVRTHPYTRKDYFQVWLHEFAASSLNILLYVFHEVPDWATELRERERLFLDIVRLADQLGVQFAFPTQTIHLHQENPDAPHPPASQPFPVDNHAMNLGIQTAQRLTQDQPWQTTKPGAVQFHQGPTPLDDADVAEDRTAGS